MKSLGRIPTDPVAHSLVRDCRSCSSKFSLSVVDLDNSLSMLKVAICPRLSVGLGAISTRKKKHLNDNVLKENSYNYQITDLRF